MTPGVVPPTPRPPRDCLTWPLLATACLSGLSPLAQSALGQSVHTWVLGRLCQAAGGGERREGQTQLVSAGLSWGLPPSHYIKFSEADLTPGSGVGP